MSRSSDTFNSSFFDEQKDVFALSTDQSGSSEFATYKDEQSIESETDNDISYSEFQYLPHDIVSSLIIAQPPNETFDVQHEESQVFPPALEEDMPIADDQQKTEFFFSARIDRFSIAVGSFAKREQYFGEKIVNAKRILFCKTHPRMKFKRLADLLRHVTSCHSHEIYQPSDFVEKCVPKLKTSTPGNYKCDACGYEGNCDSMSDHLMAEMKLRLEDPEPDSSRITGFVKKFMTSDDFKKKYKRKN